MARKESRKTTGEGGKRGQTAKGADARQKPSRGQEMLDAENRSQSRSEREEEGGGTATATLSITHEQIAERARLIWEQHGRPDGEDEQNWREAERQLKRESGGE